MATEKQRHRWRFHRAGGFDQVRIETPEELLSLADLDQKLWVALACPVDGLEFDQKTLELLDTDKDGRIRAPELLSAIAWTGSILKDPSTLVKGSPKLPLAAIDTAAEGKTLLASAKQILRNLGKKDATSISIEDTTDTAKIFAETKLNGDGIIPPGSADDEDLQQTITEMLGVVGGCQDRNGKEGVDRDKLEAFFAEAEAFSAWWRAAESNAAAVLPLGEATAAAAEIFESVKAKIDDYFTRAKLVAFDARAGGPLNRDPAEYTALTTLLLRDGLTEVASFPLAHVEANRPLPLVEGLNPAWADAMKKFRDAVVVPLLGERDTLTEPDWQALSSKLAAHEAWRAAKAGGKVEGLGLARVRAMIERDHKGKISELIAKDKALEPEAAAIASVDKLVRYHRDLHKLANNFVAFRDFYARKKATFQAGTLYIDGRSCDLCVKVADAGAHAALASLSNVYLAYCELARKGSDEKMTIVAAITNGDGDALRVGRNGIFYDRKGHDWDATVIRIVEQSISVRQAFWLPYRRIARFIEEQIEKFASSRDKAVEEKTAAGVADTTTATVEAKKPEDAPFDIGKFAGIFAAIGLALAAIGAALGSVVAGLLNLSWWQAPFVVLGVVLLISGPSMLIAFMKLRRRNIAPILDGAGWAVNARAKLNISFGASLTQVAALPPDAERSLEDPFEDRPRPWALYVALLLIAGAGLYLWRTGHLERWLHRLGEPAPGAPAVSGAPAASGAPAVSGAPAAPAK